MTIRTINLNVYRPASTTVFTGRPQGKDVREKLKLNQLDTTDEEVEIIIPEDTTSFNPSFFLGLLYDSIKKLGYAGFIQKYKIIIPNSNSDVYRALKKNIDDGFRNALNTMENKTGLDF